MGADHQSHLQQLLLGIPLSRHGVNQIGPALRGVAQSEAGNGLTGQGPFHNILLAWRTCRGKELFPEIPGRLTAQLPEPLLPLIAGPGGPVIGDLHTGPFGQVSDGVGKIEIFLFHDKLDHAAALVTAEAIENLFVRGHGKGGRLFGVEGTQAEEVGPLAGQVHILAHHLLDGVAGGQLVKKRRRKGHGFHLLCTNWGQRSADLPALGNKQF